MTMRSPRYPLNSSDHTLRDWPIRGSVRRAGSGLRLDTIRNTSLSLLVTEHAGESTLWRMLSTPEHEKALLKAHRLHAGLYRRVADKLGVDSSYVSRVATGKRKGPKILRALLDELHQIQRLSK
jgi:hypothetical protein